MTETDLDRLNKDRLRLRVHLDAVLAQLEQMGENDMGNLSHNEAQGFHALVDRLRKFVAGIEPL